MISSFATPGSSGARASPSSSSSSSRLKQPTTQSPIKNTAVEDNYSNDDSREVTPELPTSDKSDSSGNSENDTQAAISTPTYDAEIQETAIVPDSAPASPTPSLPPLSSSAVQKMLYSASKENHQPPLTPSKLSQVHLAQLQDDILAENDETLAELVIPMEDDSISLQSDLTIADLDPDDWKQLVISYGAEPRSDDEDIFDTLEPGKLQSGAARRRDRPKHASAAARKGSRASTRHVERNNKVLTPSKGTSSAHANGSLVTPARSTGKTIKTYGKRGHRATTSTSSEADTRKSARTSMTGTTSGESDCVEVTTERKAGVLRHVTPDGTIISNTEAYTPSRKATSSKKGKERAVEPPITTEEEDDDDEMDLDLPDLSPRKVHKGKSPEKAPSKDQSRSTRHTGRDRERVDKVRIRTPSLSPPPAEPAPFVPMTTATEGKALSAMEIIAQMRAKNKPVEELAEEEADKERTDDDDPDMQLYGDIDLRKRAAAIQDNDSDSDDLVDTKTMLARVKNAPRKAEKEPEQPIASTSTAISEKPKSKVKLPMDKSTQSLNKLFKSRQAEEARGWYGIDEASREESGYGRQSSSTSPRLNDQQSKFPSADTEYYSDSSSSSSSSLPDGPSTNGTKASGSKEKPKRQRRHSNGQLTRVVSHLTKSREDNGVVEAIKLAQDELEEARGRARRRKEQEGRLFWKQLGSEEDLKIEPFKPYEAAGTTGLNYALRQGILDGLANPASFPVELMSPYITSTSSLLSSVSASYSLYHLIAHPCTNPILANRVLPFLSTLLRKIPSGGALDTDIDLSSIVDSLAAMGAKKDQFTDELRSSAAIDDTPEAMVADKSDKVAFTTDQRQTATHRIMCLLRVLIETKRIERSRFPSLVILLLRMALDTSDHHMRNSAVQSLHVLLEQDMDPESLLSIIQAVAQFVGPLSFRDRYVVVSFLPLNSEHQRDLVRGLCFSLLFPSEDEQVTPIGGRRTLSLLSSTLANRKASSTFFISEDTDDVSLHYAVLLLQYLLTDLSKYYVEDVYSEEAEVVRQTTQARADALGIINGMTDIDSKLRTDVRGGNPMRHKAKNAIVRALHSMEYQLQAAQDRVEKVDLKRRLGNRTLAQVVDGQVSQGQISINSYFTKANSSKEATK